ncbi:MAG: hypothetical protein KJ077_22270 [Anaerolineae bacterium]|nr:hypothetical protein [Anaerolineae bacterium]
MGLVVEQVNISYTLTFESPFHFGTGLRNGLIHRTIVRDRDEYLYVPGSTLKGVLRDRCEQIARSFELRANEPHSEVSARTEANTKNPDIIVRIFGSRFLPSQLYFDDAMMHKKDKAYFEASTPTRSNTGKYKIRQVEQRTQVSLSRFTRTAKPGHLYTSEYGIYQLRFEGHVYGLLGGYSLEEGRPGTHPLLLLLAGLASISEIGGNKSSGAGRVSCKIADTVTINGAEINLNVILEQLPLLEYYELEQEAANDL